MATKERFLTTYNNPVGVVEAASIPVNPVGTISPRAGLGTWVVEDARNMGGKHLINGQLEKHR